MQVSQIFLSDNPESQLPVSLQETTATVKKAFPECKYKLYGEEELRQLLKDHFEGDVINAFDKVKAYAFKADLARYCLLYLYGGWYLDVTLRIHNGIQFGKEIKVFGFRDMSHYIGNTTAVDNTAIYVNQAKHSVFVDALDTCVNNILDDYYGWNPLAITGPVVWGDTIADNFVPGSFGFGDVVELTPGRQNPNKALVLPSGDIFAFKKRSGGGDLSSLGIAGTNNYNELWQFRRLYK